jgi:hypothetical protein
LPPLSRLPGLLTFIADVAIRLGRASQERPGSQGGVLPGDCAPSVREVDRGSGR